MGQTVEVGTLPCGILPETRAAHAGMEVYLAGPFGAPCTDGAHLARWTPASRAMEFLPNAPVPEGSGIQWAEGRLWFVGGHGSNGTRLASVRPGSDFAPNQPPIPAMAIHIENGILRWGLPRGRDAGVGARLLRHRPHPHAPGRACLPGGELGAGLDLDRGGDGPCHHARSGRHARPGRAATLTRLPTSARAMTGPSRGLRSV